MINTFNDYQVAALTTAQYPRTVVMKSAKTASYIYPALGLAGEAGEVAEKVKKLLRDKLGDWDELDKENIKKELGDVLWYVAVLAHEFGIDLQDVANGNINKLSSRKERGVIHGSGDNR